MKEKGNVAGYKKEKVSELVKYLNEYPIVAITNMLDVPAPQLQKMRASLRDFVVFTMTKKTLIKIAFDSVKDKKQGIEKMKDYLDTEGIMPALMFTKDNPFKLAKILAKSRSPAPAKVGQIAPKDIVVEAGATPFAPGPVIGELGALGIKTGIENGKVAIKEDAVVIKKGDKVGANAAGVLTRLGVEPMEIGLNILAAYENGIIFTDDVLSIDEKEYLNKLTSAYSEAFNLAVEVGYPTKEVLEVTIPKLHMQARALAFEANILNDETREEILGKAERQANALVSSANIDLSAKAPATEETPAQETPAPETKEETKVEETPKEEENKEEDKKE